MLRLRSGALILAAALCSGCARGPAPVFVDMVCQFGAYRVVGWIIPLTAQRARPDFLVIGYGLGHRASPRNMDEIMDDADAPDPVGGALEGPVEPSVMAGVKAAREFRTWLRCETDSAVREEP